MIIKNKQKNPTSLIVKCLPIHIVSSPCKPWKYASERRIQCEFMGGTLSAHVSKSVGSFMGRNKH